MKSAINCESASDGKKVKQQTLAYPLCSIRRCKTKAKLRFWTPARSLDRFPVHSWENKSRGLKLTTMLRNNRTLDFSNDRKARNFLFSSQVALIYRLKKWARFLSTSKVSEKSSSDEDRKLKNILISFLQNTKQKNKSAHPRISEANLLPH